LLVISFSQNTSYRGYVKNRGYGDSKLKNKRKIHALTSKTVLVTFMIMSIIFTSTVRGVTVGVKKDDWAKYGDFSASWNSTIPGQTEPPEIEEMNNVDWMKITVQSVSNTFVTVETVTHYENGTEETETMSGDIAIGSGNLTIFILPADLGEGDTIPISGLPSGIPPTINGTVTKTYAGAQRDVNYIGANVSISNQTVNLYIYWDKATGILCEYTMSMSMTYMNYTFSESMQAKITGTNLWAGGIIPGMPDYALYIIIAVVIVVIIVAAVLVTRKRKAPTPAAAPPKEEEK